MYTRWQQAGQVSDSLELDLPAILVEEADMYVHIEDVSKVLERGLTPRSLGVYLHLVDVLLTTGFAPPQAHLARLLKCSTRTVGRAMTELRREGLLGTWS